MTRNEFLISTRRECPGVNISLDLLKKRFVSNGKYWKITCHFFYMYISKRIYVRFEYSFYFRKLITEFYEF